MHSQTCIRLTNQFHNAQLPTTYSVQNECEPDLIFVLQRDVLEVLEFSQVPELDN